MNELNTERPEGLSDDEWNAVLDVRAEIARRIELTKHWEAILNIGELYVTPNSSDEDWDRTVERFSDAVQKYGDWDEDMLDEFAYALMRAQGYRTKDIRGYGNVWIYKNVGSK